MCQRTGILLVLDGADSFLEKVFSVGDAGIVTRGFLGCDEEQILPSLTGISTFQYPGSTVRNEVFEASPHAEDAISSRMAIAEDVPDFVWSLVWQKYVRPVLDDAKQKGAAMQRLGTA